MSSDHAAGFQISWYPPTLSASDFQALRLVTEKAKHARACRPGLGYPEVTSSCGHGKKEGGALSARCPWVALSSDPRCCYYNQRFLSAHHSKHHVIP